MKRKKKLYALAAFLLLSIGVFSQVPQKMSYQSIIRNASDNLVANQQVEIQISILQSSVTGVSVYIETQTPTTNANGLVSLEIGTGTVVSGDFTAIDWANDTYFIKTETDPTGGSSYTITGTSQLLSVPYALHAKTAESVTGTINYTETDPLFGMSAASGITAIDTVNWNNHTIDTDTHIDSTGITALDFVSGQHAVDTDTHIDSIGIVALGFTTGSHTIDTDIHIDSASIAVLGFTAGSHIIDADTHIDSTGITALGFSSGSHTIDTDTHIDSTGIVALGFVTGPHTLDTDTHIDSTGIAALDFVTGQHAVDTDTHIDSIGIVTFGFVAGQHTIDIDTHIDSIGITGLEFESGSHTTDTDTHIDSIGITALGFEAGFHATNSYQVGDFAQGGIVFWLDETGQHGLVCAKNNLDDGSGNGALWSLGNMTHLNSRFTGDGVYSGEANTMLIIGAVANSYPLNNTLYAARMCNELKITEGGKSYGDWYLPSFEELGIMSGNRIVINASAVANGGAPFSSDRYWSSTQYPLLSITGPIWIASLIGGSGDYSPVIFGTYHNVRAIRAF